MVPSPRVGDPPGATGRGNVARAAETPGGTKMLAVRSGYPLWGQMCLIDSTVGICVSAGIGVCDCRAAEGLARNLTGSFAAFQPEFIPPTGACIGSADSTVATPKAPPPRGAPGQ
jgi:hypothetical protein